MNSKVGGSGLPQIDSFQSQNFDTFTSTSVRETKMNVVSRAQSNFNFTTKHLYHRTQYSTSCAIKCLALIAQMVRAVSMNPKLEGSGPPQLETFSVSNLSHEHPPVSRKLILWSAHIHYSKFYFTTKLFIQPEPVFNNMGQKSLALIAQIRVTFGMSPMLGFESHSGRDIFCEKNVDTFRRTCDRETRMNVVA